MDGGRWLGERCGRCELQCSTYLASTASRRRRPRPSMRSKHSRRMVPTNRSAMAFACGARIGVLMILTQSAANTASKDEVNFVSRSRIRNWIAAVLGELH